MAASCLNCGSVLVPRKSRLGILQECPSCASRLVGFHLVRRLLPKKAADALWTRARDNVQNRSRACPLCRRGMAETGLPGDPIVLDLCLSCHMVWFDAQEFESEPFQAPEADPVLRVGLEERRAYVAAAMTFEKELTKDDDAYRFPQNTREFVLGVLRFPIEYDNPVSRLPVATWATGALVVIASLSALLDLDTAAALFGFFPEEALRWGGATFLTSFFVHGDIFHLAGNLYFLIVFGDNVEDHLGPLRFLVLLVCATVVGNLGSLLVDSTETMGIPHIGASGGISGLLSFYALRYPEARIGILFFFRILKLPAVFLLVFWIALQIFGAMIQSSMATLVDYGAHLGGAVTGVLFWFLWRKKG